MVRKQGIARHAMVSLEDIDKRLKRIEKMLSTTIPQLKKEGELLLKETEAIKKEEVLIKEEEELIEEEEKRIEQGVKRLEERESELKNAEKVLLKKLGERVPQRFSDIIDWKNLVWDRCKFKKTKEEAKTFDYYCKKLDGPCRFETCPLNH